VFNAVLCSTTGSSGDVSCQGLNSCFGIIFLRDGCPLRFRTFATALALWSYHCCSLLFYFTVMSEFQRFVGIDTCWCRLTCKSILVSWRRLHDAHACSSSLYCCTNVTRQRYSKARNILKWTCVSVWYVHTTDKIQIQEKCNVNSCKFLTCFDWKSSGDFWISKEWRKMISDLTENPWVKSQLSRSKRTIKIEKGTSHWFSYTSGVICAIFNI